MQGNDKKRLKRGFCKVIKRKQKDAMGREAIKVLAESLALMCTDHFKKKKSIYTLF